MANICDNKFYFSCDHHFKEWQIKIENLLKQHFDYNIYYCTDLDDEGGSFEAFFESKWHFPDDVFEQLFEDASKADDVYFRCLSEEYGNGYVAMNIFQDNSWRDEQCFDI